MIFSNDSSSRMKTCVTIGDSDVGVISVSMTFAIPAFSRSARNCHTTSDSCASTPGWMTMRFGSETRRGGSDLAGRKGEGCPFTGVGSERNGEVCSTASVGVWLASLGSAGSCALPIEIARHQRMPIRMRRFIMNSRWDSDFEI